MNTTKQCKRCKIEKPLDNFKINQVKCIDCNEKIKIFRTRRHNVEIFDETGYNVISENCVNKILNCGCTILSLINGPTSILNKFKYRYSKIMLDNKFGDMIKITFLNGTSKYFFVRK